MIQRILELIGREIRGLHETAYLLGLFAILSSLLALVRDRILAGQFGAGEILDVYYTAFRIPDLLFFTIALMVSVFVLVPRLARHKTREESHELIGSVLLAFGVTMFVVGVCLWPLIPHILEWKFSSILGGRYGDELVLMSRIMLLQPILLGASNILASITQTYGRYILYAIAPLLYNIGIIAGVLAFYPAFGMIGLVYGVLLGAFAHMALQIPFAWGRGFLRLHSFKLRLKQTLSIIKISLPRTIGMSANHLALFFLYSIASSISTGAIAVLQLASNLQAAPLNIVGASYSVAAFPTLSRLFADGKKSEFVSSVVMALRHIIFWSFPVAALFIILRAQVVRTVLGTGAFDWADTRLTAAVLALFILSLILQGATLLLVRAYYAAGRTIQPFIINVSSAVLMVACAHFFTSSMESNEMWRTFFETILRIEGLPGSSILMLPLAFTVASAMNLLLLVIYFSRDFGSILSRLSRIIFDAFASSVILGVAAHFALEVLAPILPTQTTLGIFSQGLFAGLAGICAWALTLLLLGNKELKEVWGTLHTRFWKRDAVIDIELTQ